MSDPEMLLEIDEKWTAAVIANDYPRAIAILSEYLTKTSPNQSAVRRYIEQTLNMTRAWMEGTSGADEAELPCSFCGLGEEDGRTLIASPDASDLKRCICICDHCTKRFADVFTHLRRQRERE